MEGIIAYALARKYAQKLSCGVAGSTYDPATSTMTVELNDGSTYGVVFDDGVTVQDRQTLDNIKYDNATSALLVGDKEVLTKEDAVSDDDNIDFGGMFG
jgi:hypothetical protein